MEFLAETWWVWLMLAVAFLGCTSFNLLLQTRKMFGEWEFAVFTKKFPISALAVMLLFGLAGVICFVLFIVGAVARLFI